MFGKMFQFLSTVLQCTLFRVDMTIPITCDIFVNKPNVFSELLEELYNVKAVRKVEDDTKILQACNSLSLGRE